MKAFKVEQVSNENQFFISFKLMLRPLKIAPIFYLKRNQYYVVTDFGKIPKLSCMIRTQLLILPHGK